MNHNEKRQNDGKGYRNLAEKGRELPGLDTDAKKADAESTPKRGHDTGTGKDGYRSLEKLSGSGINDNYAAINGQQDLFEQTDTPNTAKIDAEGVREAITLPSPLSFFCKPAVLAVIVILISFSVFLIAAQALHLIEVIARLPAVFRWIAWAGMGILLTACALAFIYLLFTLFKFKASPALTLPRAEFIEVKYTKKMQRKCQALKSEMVEYLKAYPVGAAGDTRKLRKLGVSEEDIQSLHKAQYDVLHYDKSSEQDWLRRFDAVFLSRLDTVAARRINRYSVDTGIKTAVFPINFINAAVVLINSYLMVGDLCKIYRLRSGLGFISIIFGWSFFHTLAATQLGDLTEEGAEYLMEEIAPELESGAVHILGKKFAPRLSEGVINGLILRMLGKQTMKRLKPLNVIQK